MTYLVEQHRQQPPAKTLSALLQGLVVIIGLVLATPTPAAAEEPLVFGIVPQQSASRLARDWVPIMDWLSQELGRPVVFATAKDIPTFEACLAKKAYDIAYMNPYHYVVFHKAPGYQAIARQQDKRLQGILVTKADSPIQSLQDLAGSSIAFPSPAAFGASVLPRAELKANGIAFTPDYVKSHDSVYRAVAAGLYPAGGGVLRTWNTIPEDLRDQLRIFYTTAAYTPHAIAVGPDVSAETATAIQQALLTISSASPALLQPIGMKGFELGADSDWNDIRALELDREQTGVLSEATDQCRSG